jgi:hypothetical protein
VIETGTYNGVIPGPTFRIKAGDTLKIGLINNLTLPGVGQACPPLNRRSSSIAGGVPTR